MIYDKIERLNKYKGVIPHIQEVVEFFNNTDLLELPYNEKINISKNVYAIRSKYYGKSLSEALVESHLKYIDIQVIISGKEMIYYGLAPENKGDHVGYDENKDIIYQRSFSSLVPYGIQEGMTAKRIIGLCKVKDALREVFNVQLRDGSDIELENAQAILNKEYDEFYKKYGYINDSVNARAFDNDPDYYLLTSIENKNAEVIFEDAYNEKVIKSYKNDSN